ncbi:MAG: hypothetical protein M1816_003952 [Peltula sp. TS41687]|nr:MAG: hypothetical protein M1816_003952 [Peltula sp. TS41687]
MAAAITPRQSLQGSDRITGSEKINPSSSATSSSPDEKADAVIEVQNSPPTHFDGHNPVHNDGLTFRKFMVLVAMSFHWISSQIPLYLYGGVIPLIVADIGGVDRYVWIPLGFFIPLAAVTPFVGQLSDLLGRRELALGACVVVIAGNIMTAKANTMNIFIGGMVIMGAGSGVLELTSLAVAGEMAPAQSRGLYVGCVILTIALYGPSVLYGQLVSTHGTWRWIGLWVGLWVFIGLVLTAIFFFPPKRRNDSGFTRRQLLGQIDYIGGFLSSIGFTLFLAGLTWGASQYPWRSVHVLAPMLVGLFIIFLFVCWEMWGAKYPMFPARLRRSTRAIIAIFVISCVSGANFFTLLLSWPTQYSLMYADNKSPVSIGTGSLPISYCILGGSVIVLTLISFMRKRVRLIMIISCMIMIAGNGALAAAKLDNLNGIYAALVFAALGTGAVIVPCSIIASIICPDDLIGTSIAATIALRIVGGAIGYAVSFTIQTQKFTKAAPTIIGEAAVRAGITDPLQIRQVIVLLASNLPERVRGFVQTDEAWQALVYAGKQAQAQSFPPTYYVAIGFGAVALLAAFFLPDISEFMDGHVAVDYNDSV